MNNHLFLTLAATFICGAAMAQTTAPAFPGAEGNGRYTTGGRGGKIIHVTNLNDSGTGSLRAAVSGSLNKTIVFDVGGVIPMSSDLSIGANTTILGQTAPYPGITLRYYTVEPGANNIIRFIRIRRGQEKNVNDGADATWKRNITSMIIDHCSFSWSIDEVASFYDNNNYTMQWCTVGESLNKVGHNKGAHGYGGIWGGKLASFHHNMIAHVNNRAPRFNGARYNWTGYTANTEYAKYNWQNAVQSENVDFRNCLVFDWGGGGCYGGPGGGYINMINNYYKATPETSNKNRVTQISIANSTTSSTETTYLDMTSRYYINGNYVYNYGANYDWNGVKYDSGIQTINGEAYSFDSLYYYGKNVEHVNNVNGIPCVKIKLDKETAPAGEITTHSAENAYAKILNYCGASLFRDDVDLRYMNEVKGDTSTYTGSVTNIKGRIDVVSDVDGYTERNFPTGSRASNYDSDNDGMPDVWETANGLNPADASDAITYTLDTKGYYTNVEVFANSLVEDIMRGGNADALTPVNEYYPTCTKVAGLDYYSGRIVERIIPAPVDPNPGPVGDSIKGNVSWSFKSGGTESATYSADVANGIASSTVTLGDSLKFSGTTTVNGTIETVILTNSKLTSPADVNALTFSFALKDGYLFQPDSVSFTVSRIGTDSGLLDISYQTGTSTTVLDAAILPNRNNETGGYYTYYKKAVSGVVTTSGTHQLIVNIYQLNATKQNAFADIAISGLLFSPSGISRPATVTLSPNSKCYNLSGQAVDETYKGVVIKKGKKIIQR